MTASPALDVLSRVCRRDAIPLPGRALRLALDLVADSEVNDRAIVEHCDDDPRLSFMLLVGANCSVLSPSRPQPVKSVAQAVATLGRDRSRALLWLLALSDLFQRQSDRPGRPLDRVWRHSLLTAVIAEQFAEGRPGFTRGMALATGMAHDVGHALLRHEIAPPLALLDPGEESAAEIVAPDHCSVGAALLALWNAPGPLVAAARYHHAPAEAGEHAPLVAIVRLADLVAGQLERDPPLRPGPLSAQPVWNELAKLASEDLSAWNETELIERLPEALFVSDHLARLLGT